MSDVVREYAQKFAEEYAEVYAEKVAIKTFIEAAVMFEQDKDKTIVEACKKFGIEREEAEMLYDEYASVTI